jgi:hypothetical protein
MAGTAAGSQIFNVVVVGQQGRLSYEALIFAASLRHSSPDFKGRLIVAEPQPGPLWENNPSIKDPEIREAGISASNTPTATRSRCCSPCPKANLLCFLTPIH